MSLFDALADDIVRRAETLFRDLEPLALPVKVDVINRIRQALHQRSPFAAEPVDCVLWVPAEEVTENDYNPNTVAPPEMRLLEHSIRCDGYTQPIVTCREENGTTKRHVVDGAHRKRVGTESKSVRERVLGYLPVTEVRTDRADRRDRMAATVRHNRARGVHGVMPMVAMVGELLRQGWTDEEVGRELGMDRDEVFRFKQNTGLPELFKDHPYSKAWE